MCNFFFSKLNHKFLFDSFINLLYIAECSSCEIEIKLFGIASINQRNLAGSYTTTDPVNGKQAWISTSGNNAIWYNDNSWVLGAASDIGSGFGGIFSIDNEDCPQNVLKWEVNTNDGQLWVNVPSSDVSIGCVQLAGNLDQSYYKAFF